MPIILASQEAKIGELQSMASPGKKLARSPSQQISMVVHAFDHSYLGGIDRKTMAL
jgi:hypothetical protein